MNVKLSSIQRDQSIQCRAHLSVEAVNAYAEVLTNGGRFDDDIVLFGTTAKSWVGDGWHRLAASEQIGALEIEADVRPGGRIEALRYALGANAAHGVRRTNADKRRAVEIALREFGNLSGRAIAEMCGVSDKTVEAVRGPIAEIPQCSTRTTADGRQYPAHRKLAPEASPAFDGEPDDAVEEQAGDNGESEQPEGADGEEQEGRETGKEGSWASAMPSINDCRIPGQRIEAVGKAIARLEREVKAVCKAVQEYGACDGEKRDIAAAIKPLESIIGRKQRG